MVSRDQNFPSKNFSRLKNAKILAKIKEFMNYFGFITGNYGFTTPKNFGFTPGFTKNYFGFTWKVRKKTMEVCGGWVKGLWALDGSVT